MVVQGLLHRLHHPEEEHVLGLRLERFLDIGSWYVTPEARIECKAGDIAAILNWHQQAEALAITIRVEGQVADVEDAMGQ